MAALVERTCAEGAVICRRGGLSDATQAESFECMLSFGWLDLDKCDRLGFWAGCRHTTYFGGHQASLAERRSFFAYATLISLGLTTGIAQWVVMQRYLSNPIRWVVGTLLGYLLCLIIFVGSNMVRLGREGLWDDVLLLGLVGTAIGACQWWVLRQNYHQSGLWIPATAVGFLCFLWAIINPSHSLGEHIIRGAIVGTFTVVAPGMTLVYLVRKRLGENLWSGNVN